MMMLDDDERTNGRHQQAWAYVHNWVLPCNRLAAKKTRKFHHIFFYYSIFFLLFLSLVSLKQSPAATAAAGAAAAMQWPEDATRVSEASKA